MDNLWYAYAEMLPERLAAFFILLALGKAARRFNIGPQWLRQFKSEKHTFY
jgi:hypothetical protein